MLKNCKKMYFARDVFFDIGFPSDLSKSQSKIKLKSTQKTFFFCYDHQLFKIVFLEWSK